MRTPRDTVAVMPGAFVVHPPGEVHEYANGSARTLLFRVRYGADMSARHFEWRGRDGWTHASLRRLRSRNNFGRVRMAMIGADLAGLPAGDGDVAVFDAAEDFLDMFLGVEFDFIGQAENPHGSLLGPAQRLHPSACGKNAASPALLATLTCLGAPWQPRESVV
jgi:hypothetical protein